MITPDDIVEYARTWRGTRWKHLGRNERGLDCVGLLYLTAAHFELPGEDMSSYSRVPRPELLRHIGKYSNPLRPMIPVHGAIGVFHDTVTPCHTGIFAVNSKGRVTVIHCDARRRRCLEEGYEDSSPSLKSRLVDIRLFQQVDYVV